MDNSGRKELDNTARSKRGKAHKPEWVAQNRLAVGLRFYCHSFHSALPDLPHTEIKGCGRSFTLYPDSKALRWTHCFLQVSPSLGGPWQALGIPCNGQTILCCCTAEEFPLDRAHRSLHSTTGPQESSGKASSAERSRPQRSTKSNKYYLDSWKTSYKKL